MAAETATNPTTEGNREHTYKYLNSTDRQTDMIVNMLPGIKMIQHEMVANLLSSGKTTPRWRNNEDMMQRDGIIDQERKIEDCRIMSKQPARFFRWGNGNKSSVEDEEEGIQHMRKSDAQLLPLTTAIKGNGRRRHKRETNQPPWPPPPPCPPPHGIFADRGRVTERGPVDYDTICKQRTEKLSKDLLVRFYRLDATIKIPKCIKLVVTSPVTSVNEGILFDFHDDGLLGQSKAHAGDPQSLGDKNDAPPAQAAVVGRGA